MTFKFLAVSLLICAASFPLAAQNTAEIRGKVTDSTGAILPGALLTLTNKGGNQERTQTVSPEGDYVFASLPNGEYLLKAELTRFKTQIRDGIILQAGQRINLDLTLEVGTIAEAITVTEAAPLLRTNNAEVSEVIENQRLNNLPLNGRQFVQLSLLLGGNKQTVDGSDIIRILGDGTVKILMARPSRFSERCSYPRMLTTCATTRAATTCSSTMEERNSSMARSGVGKG